MTFSKRKKKTVMAIDPLKKKKRLRVGNLADEEVEVHKAELLDIQTIREDMLLLGCIIEIRSDCFLMSLPGCLVGTVPVTNISRKYTELLKNSAENVKSEEVTLKHLFDVGAVFPCKVLQVIHDSSKKPNIILSIDPQVVNCNLKRQSLYSKMVLYAAVVSIEDHGYVLDVGISGMQGFLPFNAATSNKLLTVGQVLPTQLTKLPSKKDVGNAISLAGLSFEDIFPEITDENVKLSAILPGARVCAYVSEVTRLFVYMKCFDFEACSNLMSAYNCHKKIKDSTKVSGTVLYIHPVTNTIYLHLGPLPTPKSYQNFFNLQKYDKIKNLKFHASYHNKLFFKYQNVIGYVKSGDVAGKSSLSFDSLIKNPLVSKARVVFLHYIDNLVQLTFKESMLKRKIVRPEDVKIGDVYEATVKKHVEDGMFVSICPGLSGFVRHIFFSDSFITMPEKLYPVGTNVKCRVLSVHPPLGLSLTCKESLINLPDDNLLKSYEESMGGKSFKGTIVKKTDEYVLVLFFNDVKGIISSESIPKTSLFYVGQTVLCSVLHCDPVKKKLKLSLDSEKRLNSICSSANKRHHSPYMGSQISSALVDNEGHMSSSKGTNIKEVIAHSFSQSLSKPEFTEGKTYKAFIKKITAHQLNIVVNGTEKGRVHITNIGCSEEDALPLKQFAVGQRIKVYVLKEYEQRSKNYLAISHQNMTSFLECSLIYPSPVSSDLIFNTSEPQLGYIKKIYDVCASVWLSPYHCGILDFINASENVKTLRELKKNFEVGQSIAVSLLAATASPKNKGGKMKLIKPGISVPDVGKNIPGLVTVASPDRDLILNLPHGYTGIACLTDILDVYTSLQPLLEKFKKLKFILCHVLEVNHVKKTSVLSLRKSRLYSEKIKSSKDISPELSSETIQQGQKVKGYIRSVFETHIIVNIGRNLYGKVTLHKCTKYECVLCLKIAGVRKTSAVGSVIEVIIDGVTIENDFIPLSLPDISNAALTEDTWLNVKEDINWDDLQ